MCSCGVLRRKHPIGGQVAINGWNTRSLELQANSQESSRELRDGEELAVPHKSGSQPQFGELMARESRLSRRSYWRIHLRQPAVAVWLGSAGHAKKLFLDFPRNGTR